MSASKDKTCVIWNYRSGQVLRTLLFPSFPVCLALDPGTRGVFVSMEDRSMYSIELFGREPLLGPNSEDASTVVQISSPFSIAPTESGPASCLALAHDGALLLSGHPKGQIHIWGITERSASSGPKELTNLNAPITNIVFIPPLSSAAPTTKAWNIIKPSQAQRAYNLNAQFEADHACDTPFATMVKTPGFSEETLDAAITAFLQPTNAERDDKDLEHHNHQQWQILNQLKATP